MRALDRVVEALVDALTGEDAGIASANGGQLDSGFADGGIGGVDLHGLVREGFEQDFFE